MIPNFPLSVTTLRTEYLENPLGIDIAHPVLGWKIVSSSRNIRQSGYQVQVSKTQARFNPGDLLWDSGKFASDQTQGIYYAGEKLASGQRVTWRVRVWNQADCPSDWSEPAWWEMGMLDEAEKYMARAPVMSTASGLGYQRCLS
jgi:alpha-L-rhamnosidase